MKMETRGEGMDGPNTLSYPPFQDISFFDALCSVWFFVRGDRRRVGIGLAAGLNLVCRDGLS